MTTPDTGTGGGSQIPQRQNQPRHLERLRAYTHLYNVAQRWRRTRTIGTVTLALLGPALALATIDTNGVLAAASAAWLVLGRALLIQIEDNTRERAVRVQELFDTGVFQLPWNTSVTGREPLTEDVVRAARAVPDNERFQNWYDLDLRAVSRPLDILLCQRQAMAWSRGDHSAYAVALAITASAWVILSVVIAITMNLSLTDYLVKLFLPTAPAVLDAVQLHTAHRRHSTDRETQLGVIDGHVRAQLAGTGSVTLEDCRHVQDAAFLLRSTTPRVPGWFYRRRRTNSQADTAAAIDALREDS